METSIVKGIFIEEPSASFVSSLGEHEVQPVCSDSFSYLFFSILLVLAEFPASSVEMASHTGVAA